MMARQRAEIGSTYVLGLCREYRASDLEVENTLHVGEIALDVSWLLSGRQVQQREFNVLPTQCTNICVPVWFSKKKLRLFP
jgi:hypothetical protein